MSCAGRRLRPRGAAAIAACAATLALAAGARADPVVYTASGDGADETRIVGTDGSDDHVLGPDVRAAVPSPDGRRVAVVTTTSSEAGQVRRLRSTLRFTDAGGRAPRVVTDGFVAFGAPAGEREGGTYVLDTPVWAPDGGGVLVRALVNGDGPFRLRCEPAGGCRSLGPVGGRGFASPTRSDVVAWTTATGPLLADRSAPEVPRLGIGRRCGERASAVRAAAVRIRPLQRPSAFGPDLVLRRVPGDDPGPDDVPPTADQVGVGDGLLSYDRPRARVSVSRVRCSGRSRAWTTTATLGRPRLLVRRGGASTALPRPAGLDGRTGLRLVALSDGGALLVAQSAGDGRTAYECGRSRDSGCTSPGSLRGPAPAVGAVWRYRPGARSLVRAAGVSRASARVLRGASGVARAPGDAVVAAEGGRVLRVPLDGGAPVVLARGSALGASGGAGGILFGTTG